MSETKQNSLDAMLAQYESNNKPKYTKTEAKVYDLKNYFNTFIKDGVKHIADIFNSDKNLVIEIQHSNITPVKIKEREDFYDNMIWLIDETTNHCNNCKNDICKDYEYYIKICDKCKQKNCCNNKIIILIEGENFLIIKNINNPFFLSATKPVFLHMEKYSSDTLGEEYLKIFFLSGGKYDSNKNVYHQFLEFSEPIYKKIMAISKFKEYKGLIEELKKTGDLIEFPIDVLD
jgi:hypothetical protein